MQLAAAARRLAGVLTFGILWGLLPCRTAMGDSAKNNYFSLDLGLYETNVPQRYSAPTGYSTLVSNLFGYGRIRRGFHLGKRFFFEPSFALALPWRGNVDGGSETFPLQLGLDFSLPIPLIHFIKLRAGPGIHADATFSRGGTAQLNNGTSYSTFYLPSDPSIALLFTTDLGMEILVSRRISLVLDVLIDGVASQARRRFNAAATFGVRL